MYLHFMSFFHTDMTQVVENFPHADDLATQGAARTSATMIFTMVNQINSASAC